jgi:branched-chain amino acid transport system ATP-binding protein
VLLEVRNLKVFYGHVEALKGVSLKVNKTESVVVLGANGAGKSTLLETIVGLHRTRDGEVLFENMPIHNKSSVVIKKLGLSLSPQGRGLFVDQSVEDNLLLGAYIPYKERQGRREAKRDLEWIYDSFPILKARKKQLAGYLSGGEQQLLSFSRALMSRPRVLLLDEPSLGLAPLVIDEMFDIIKQQNERGTTILLVEQCADKSLQIAHRGYILETGKIALEGESKDLLNEPKFKELYFGIR